MKSISSRIFLCVLVLGLLVVAFANYPSILAQEATQSPSIPPPVVMEGTRSNEGMSSIRVVNASPDVPSIRVALNGQSLAEELSFGTYKEFVDFPAGTYTVEVMTAAASAILSKEVVLAPDVSATFILTGLTNGIGQTGLDLSVFLTEHSPTRGKTRLEVINAIPDVAAVDLIGSEPLLTDIGSGKIADAALNLDAGTYDFQIVSSDSQTSILDLNSTQLQADTIYTIVLIGQQSNSSVKPLVLMTNPVASSATPTPAATIVNSTVTITPTTQTTLVATTTASPTSEATVETTREATVEVTSEVPTAESTREATAEVTVSP